MSHTIHISDEAYAAIAATAASSGRTPESVVEEWAAQLARDPDQAWFWTPEWQAGERRAQAELQGGLGRYSDNLDDFPAALHDDADVWALAGADSRE
jgi:hypothetical protein